MSVRYSFVFPLEKYSSNKLLYQISNFCIRYLYFTLIISFFFPLVLEFTRQRWVVTPTPTLVCILRLMTSYTPRGVTKFISHIVRHSGRAGQAPALVHKCFKAAKERWVGIFVVIMEWSQGEVSPVQAWGWQSLNSSQCHRRGELGFLFSLPRCGMEGKRDMNEA